MTLNARYGHTNLNARDWRVLAQFYEIVFGCTPVPPERDYSGETFDALTGLSGARQRGMHLRLPGCGDDGPTLEIFEYTPDLEKPETAVNRHGFGHIAFKVENVPEALELVRANGGGAVGEIVTLTRSDGRKVTLCYATDPEQNVIELQVWS
jgi:predicted enzyme related to lactoylglutathione lyase